MQQNGARCHWSKASYLVSLAESVVLPPEATSTAEPKSPRSTPSQSTSPVLVPDKNTFSG